MAWSTSELAELAGTTVNTVRHYHRLGLLPEPERRYNGYKQYDVRHLVRLLRIRRLTDLGIALSRIGEMEDETADPTQTLQELDGELSAHIARLQQARVDISTILRDGAPADGPAGFEAFTSRLSEADRGLLHLSGRFYDEKALSDLREMVAADTDPVGDEITALAADAGEEERQHLAERLAPILAGNFVDYPWLLDPAPHLERNYREAEQTFVEAIVELYNPAQLDVLVRASAIARASLDEGDPAPT